MFTFAPESLIRQEAQIDYRQLVSRSDLRYTEPVKDSLHGLPIGNGRMGTLVWTSPNCLHLQINRVDVFPFNSYSTADTNMKHRDYCGGCGFITIRFGDEVFTGQVNQHLSVYDAQVSVDTDDVSCHLLAWHKRDVIAVKVTDQRTKPQPVTVELSMLRPRLVTMGHHRAESKIHANNEQEYISLEQIFSEKSGDGPHGDHYCASAVVIKVIGCNATARIENEQTVGLQIKPVEGSFTVLIGSTASFDITEDVCQKALDCVVAAEAEGYQKLFASNQEWWHQFWSKSFLHMHSDDDAADELEKHCNYFLYVMASSSRGKYPPKFNGMLWTTGGDERAWGSQFWWHNEQSFYRALMAANHFELMEPVYNLYSSMYENQEIAARQQWGSSGIYIPETVAFNGLERLPDQIAQELQDLLLERKAWNERSAEFDRYIRYKHPHSSRYNFIGKNCEPYSHVGHFFASGAKIAYLYWQRYEYTMDDQWLRERAYPMIRGVAEFYRCYPNLRLAEDGHSHLYNVNSGEPVWGATDPLEELTAMHAILPVAIRAAEILGVDNDLRQLWQELLDSLAELPTSNDPDGIVLREHPQGLETWVQGRYPAKHVQSQEREPWHLLAPFTCYPLYTLESDNDQYRQLAHATLEKTTDYRMLAAGHNLHGISELPIGLAILGRTDELRIMLPRFIKQIRNLLPNRMSLEEGKNAISVQHLGTALHTVQLALCQCNPKQPGDEHSIIRLYPAFPRDWNAAFRFLCKGGFLVSSSIRRGVIEFVEIKSQLGGLCKLRNPWPESMVRIYRNGVRRLDQGGELLMIPTDKGDRFVFLPKV